MLRNTKIASDMKIANGPSECLEQAGAQADDEPVERADADEREDRPDRAGVGSEAQPADQVGERWHQQGGRRDDRVAAAWQQGRRKCFEDRGGDVAADRADDHEHEDAEPDLVPGRQGADLAYDELGALGRRDGAGEGFGCGRDEAAVALATITVAGCLGLAVGTNAALRSRWRTWCAASATVTTGRMSNAEPAAFSRPARSGAVSAGGPTTPTLMLLGWGLW